MQIELNPYAQRKALRMTSFTGRWVKVTAKRAGTPDEVEELAKFLTSRRERWITGREYVGRTVSILYILVNSFQNVKPPAIWHYQESSQ